MRCPKCRSSDPGKCKELNCPLKTKFYKKRKLTPKEHYFGASPNIFVGRFNYPNINVGILNTENYSDNDSPSSWLSKKYTIPDILAARSELINANSKKNIKQRNLSLIKEIALSKNPVDTEIFLAKKPSFSLTFNKEAKPFGPSVKLKKAEITENPKIPKKVEKVTSEYDLKAKDALSILGKRFDEHYLVKIFSTANLGIKTERKLVPTRWAITAVDDMIGREKISAVKKFSPIENCMLFSGDYFGNYYFFLLFPGKWSYELIELSLSSGETWHDYEFYNGRKEYAKSTVGGYYAARLAVLELLEKKKIQASVLAIRLITPDYYAPLGVWVCREASRNSAKSKPLEFNSKELMFSYLEEHLKRKFLYSIKPLLSRSVLIDFMKKQKTLSEF